MTEDAIDIDIHLFLWEKFYELHIAVSNCIHERVPVVRRIELVNKMWEGIEEIDDLLRLSRFCIISIVHIQQKILLTYGCLVTWL